MAFAAIIGYGIWQLASHGQFAAERWAPFTDWAIWQYLLVGLLGTLEAAAIVAVLGGALGIVLASAASAGCVRCAGSAPSTSRSPAPSRCC